MHDRDSRQTRLMTTLLTVTGALAGAALCALAPLQPARAQSLRGSVSSVDRMYHRARVARLHFYETPGGVHRAVATGRLVRLTPDDDFALHKVGYPYVLPTTRTFVERLGAQYQAACGQQLEVTSGVRPEDRQPPNSVARSVHPTGMAVDLHKPDDPKCLRWLRRTLLEMEGSGLVEATEEFAPPHFHVAIYPRSYQRYVASRTRSTPKVELASSSAEDASTYKVRTGDTLWGIAQAHDTSVEAITDANHLDDSVIQPGQELVIPSGS